MVITMSRVALIGENSIAYINRLINIWNDNDCAVLIDCQIPPKAAVKMMVEAKVERCYIEHKYYDGLREIFDASIDIIPYEKENTLPQLLPEVIYEQFQEKYEKSEAIVIYSSGTTGEAKGIILSHYAINTNADAIIDYMQLDNKDLIYIVKNLTHSSTLIGELLVALKIRMPLLLAPIAVPPRYALKNVVKFGVTVLGVNPVLLSMYCDEYKNKKYDLSTLKKIYVSGSILKHNIYERAKNTFLGQQIFNVYGLSEAGPRVAAQRYGCCRSNSVGKAINGVEIVCVDEYGNIVSEDELGIIHVNTPSKFNGYIHGNIKHSSLYKDWLNTGDVGYIDNNGELYIVSRIDDMINIGGLKLYPDEVECHIQSVANIQESAVSMVNFQNNDILCCIYVSEKEIRQDIKNILNAILMKHEIPELFIRVSFIPRTWSGKVDINKVKEIILQELNKRYFI